MGVFRNGVFDGVLMGAGIGGMLLMTATLTGTPGDGWLFWYFLSLSSVAIVLGSPKSGVIK
jgi:hypothetical protein